MMVQALPKHEVRFVSCPSEGVTHADTILDVPGDLLVQSRRGEEKVSFALTNHQQLAPRSTTTYYVYTGQHWNKSIAMYPSCNHYNDSYVARIPAMPLHSALQMEHGLVARVRDCGGVEWISPSHQGCADAVRGLIILRRIPIDVYLLPLCIKCNPATSNASHLQCTERAQLQACSMKMRCP